MPAVSNPARAARVPVPPSATTPLRMSATVRAVVLETTRRTISGRFCNRTLPSSSTTRSTMNGFMSRPPLAMAEKAMTIWRGVTATDCPKEAAARSMPYHAWCGRTFPATSPGRSTPVLSPKPNRRM